MARRFQRPNTNRSLVLGPRLTLGSRYHLAAPPMKAVAAASSKPNDPTEISKNVGRCCCAARVADDKRKQRKTATSRRNFRGLRHRQFSSSARHRLDPLPLDVVDRHHG